MSKNQHIFTLKIIRFIVLLVIPSFLIFSLDSRGIGVRPSCISLFTYSYINDGQDHSMYFDSTQSNNIKVHFCKDIVYHISACNNQSASFLFELYDNKGLLIYSNKNGSKENEWSLKFNDPMDCNIKLTKLSPQNSPVAVNLLIGFKP